MSKSGINIHKRSIGVFINAQGTADITLWAPHSNTAGILLEESQEILPMEQHEYGYWQLTTPKLKAGDLYKIVLDGGKRLPDPASLSQPNGVHGPSQAADPAQFDWSDQLWKNFPLAEYILYELHTGTFTPESSFEGIEGKLDYLSQLGINAIEIMPVAQFPGAMNWGYDGVYPFAVQDSYGGVKGLQHLVEACHSKGIAVVLDVVYNHMGPEGNYMRDFGPYFTSKYSVPWGEAINLDDEWSDGVRRYIVENVMMWFRDFHIDALRMDAVHALRDFSAENILQEIREATDALMKMTGRKHYLIAECDLNDTKYINAIEKGGYGMDAQWIDEFHHALRITAGGDRHGYYSDFNGISHLAKAYKDAYVYNGIYSPHRKKTFGSREVNNPGEQFIVFSQNHDQVGNRMLGERSSELVSFEMRKLMAGAVMISPYIPMLFMGEEYSEPNPFLYFVSHTDPALRKIVSEGRRKEFEAFHADGIAPDPSEETTFTASRLQWQLIQQEPHRSMLKFYEMLIATRKENTIMKNMNRERLEVSFDEQQQTMILYRWEENQYLVCLMNFSKQAQTVAAPSIPGERKILVDSASPEWQGPAASPENLIPGATLTLQPESFLLYV